MTVTVEQKKNNGDGDYFFSLAVTVTVTVTKLTDFTVAVTVHGDASPSVPDFFNENKIFEQNLKFFLFFFFDLKLHKYIGVS